MTAKITSTKSIIEDRGSCAYCGKPATTDDHIPPQSLFTPPRPDNLITVPSCSECNNGASNDDEIFRNELSIMAGSFGESAKAAERLQPTLRAIKRNKRVLEEKVLAARPIERHTPGGIYLGLGYAVPVDSGAHQRVLKRVVRGLYWNHFKVPLDATIQITLVFIDKSKPNWQDALSALRNLGPKHVQVGDGETFQYLYGRANDDPAFSFWLLIFFSGSGEQIVLAHTQKNDQGVLEPSVPADQR